MLYHALVSAPSHDYSISMCGLMCYCVSLLLQQDVNKNNIKINYQFYTAGEFNDGLKINFESVEQRDEQNFKAIIGKFVVEHNGGQTDIMQPELRIYNQPNIITSEADIKTTLYKDKFMTMNSVQNQEYFNIRYQVKPFMIWIWLSTFLISLSGLIGFFKKRYEN